MTPRTRPLLLLLAGVASACTPKVEAPNALEPTAGFLPDEAERRGVDYRNRSGTPEKATILEAEGAGVALLDLGADGDLDIVFAQGLDSVEAFRDDAGADLEVFENDGTGRFERRKGPGLSGWWTGLAVGDVDNDGRDDLVVAGIGAVVLLRQTEDGELQAIRSSGLEPAEDEAFAPGDAKKASAPTWPTSLALFDANGDGALDLYVARYLSFDLFDPPLDALGEGELAVPCRFKGYPVFCGPSGLEPQSDLFYLGNGKGQFVDATSTYLKGLNSADNAVYSLGVAALDVEGDGDTDLIVAADSTANRLWINHDGEGFHDRAMHAGVALSQDGRAEAGMGVAVGDVNLDGVQDFVVTNFSSEPTELYFGTGAGFQLATYKSGLSRETRRLLSWGVHLFDVDADLQLELFTANGHVYPQADEPYTGTSYGQRDSLWTLPHSGAVQSLEHRYTENCVLAPELGSRGSAVGDLDGNGTPDLVITRIDGPAGLGMNYEGGDNTRLVVKLIGAPSLAGPEGKRTPRDAHGARIAVILPGEEAALLGEVQTAEGFQSSSSAPLHFGLGSAAEYGGLKVFWPSGRTQSFPAGPANRFLTITEASDDLVSRELP